MNGAKTLNEFLVEKGMSPRQREVCFFAKKGLSNKEIAQEMYITEKTVKFHFTDIYRIMGVKSRAGLMAALYEFQPPVEEVIVGKESRNELPVEHSPTLSKGT